MASNIHKNGSGDATVNFGRAVRYLLVNVQTGTMTLSFDGGVNTIGLDATGFFNFPIGPVNEIEVTATGDWQIVGIQA